MPRRDANLPAPEQAPRRREGRDQKVTPQRLTESWILACFDEPTLAAFLDAVLPPEVLRSLPTELGLAPLPGKRLKTMSQHDHAVLLARAALEHARPRTALIAALDSQLPAPLLPATSDIGAEEAGHWIALADRLPQDLRIAAVLSLLASDQHAERATAAITAGFLHRDNPQRAKSPRADDTKGGTPRKAAMDVARDLEEARTALEAVRDRDASYKARIESLQRELATAQERLGQRNREQQALRAQLERMAVDLADARDRAARHRKAYDEVRRPSEREREHLAQLEHLRSQAEIERSKVEILEYQIDLLEQPGEPGHSKRKARTDSGAADPLCALISAHTRNHGAPRVLVVGGAGKQLRHRERDFERLKERLGITGEWRFADYRSWHRNLTRLRNDMRDRFDLVFVLHWNRTTFVQKMHDEARSVNTRVRTVPYSGFVSLELAIREDVEHFVRDGVG